MIILKNKKFIKKPPEEAISPYKEEKGIFETLRTFNKKPLLIDLHLKRLFNSAKKIGLKTKHKKEEIAEMVEKIIKKSRHKTQKIKIIVTQKNTIITSIKAKIDKKIYSGVAIKSTNTQRIMPKIKLLSYFQSFIAHENAVEKGFFDALLIDNKNEVYEGAYSNIFWFEKDFLCTRKEKVLPGITREIILKKTKFKIKFKRIKLRDLKKQKEIFITQSINLVVPVTKIDGTKINKGNVGDKTKTVMRELNSLLFSSF